MIGANLCNCGRRRVETLCAALLVLVGTWSAVRVGAQDEVRALWVVRTSLTSPSAVGAMVAAAKTAGFNALLVQVRGRADAYYASGLEPRPSVIANQPAFDPLAVTIERAHAAGLQVHAWVNLLLVSGANELPAERDHIVYRHPEWLMVPRALGEDLASIDPRSPEYVGRLTRYVRGQPSEIEGLYLSPISAGAADYTVAVVRDIVERYAVDGVHLDYARYPVDDYDYSRDALDVFRASVAPDLTSADRRRYDDRLAGEPLLYTRAFPVRWRAFRTERLTDLIGRLKDTVRAARPGALLSAAVGPDPVESASRRLQDWRAWLERDLVDVICPMAYSTDNAVFASQIAVARDLAGHHPLWAGIGAYRLTSSQIADDINTARRLGVGGIVLFSYDSLTHPSGGPDYLAQVARALGSGK
jgi:uncharacterized lipoprotein YddW (UPF0748 family)